MRHDMNDVKNALRLYYKEGISIRKAAIAAGIPRSTVSDYIKRLEDSGLSPEEALDLSFSDLKEKLVPEKTKTPARALPDPAYVAKEIKKPGVTYLLLWQEYIESNPLGYSYTQFKYYMNDFRKKLEPSYRNHYRGGEVMFADFSGTTIPFVDNGIKTEAEIFVSTLGASSCLFAKAVKDQTMESFNIAHKSAFSYYGGVTETVVPDNLKSAVIKHTRKELNLNASYKDLARHYGFTINPARVYKPKDKASVENGVKIVKRWIIAALRNYVFFSIDEINKAIIPMLDRYNNRKMRYVDKSRFELLNEIELPNMGKLPEREYFYRNYVKRLVPKDYHIEVDKAFYSVPFNLIGQTVSVWYAENSVEIYHNGEIKAVHPRVKDYSTLKEHMPLNHYAMTERYDLKKFIAWALEKGFNTAKFVKKIMEKNLHITVVHRYLSEFKETVKHYDSLEVENACRKALSYNATDTRYVYAILRNKEKNEVILKSHENIRGENYYQEEL